MKWIFICSIAMLCVFPIYAQHSLKAIIKDMEGNLLPGSGASIKALNRSAIADSNGIVRINNIPTGKFEILFSHVGFKEKALAYTFPVANGDTAVIELEEGFRLSRSTG